MTRSAQKWLAVGASLTAVALFIGANAHLLAVALQSQPQCREAAGMMPAKPAC